MTSPYFPEGFDEAGHSAESGRHLDAILTALGTRQHTTVSNRQVSALGFPPRRLERRVASGQLSRISHGIYGMGSTVPTRSARRMIGIHAGGSRSVLADLSAAAHLGAPVTEPRTPRVILPTGVRLSRRDVSARDARVDDHERQVVDDIPCLTWPRLLLDLAAHRPPGVLAHVWHDLVYHRRLDETGIERVLADHGGEPGIVALRALWDARQKAIGASRNKFESDLRDIVVAAGMPEPRRNARLWIDGVCLRPDVYIPERGLAVETDGKDGHGDPEQQRDDAIRDALYRRLGLLPVRYAWWPVTYQALAVQADFARYEAWWQRTGGGLTSTEPPPLFRLARRSSVWSPPIRGGLHG